MGKRTKRTVEAAPVQATDYIIWDDEIPGFGIRIFASGKRSYIIQYRSQGRSRRFTIGGHANSHQPRVLDPHLYLIHLRFFDFDRVTERLAGRKDMRAIMAGDRVVVGFSAVKGAWVDFLSATPLINVFRYF